MVKLPSVGKLETRLTGPYRVIRVNKGGSFEAEEVDGKKRVRLPANRAVHLKSEPDDADVPLGPVDQESDGETFRSLFSESKPKMEDKPLDPTPEQKSEQKPDMPEQIVKQGRQGKRDTKNVFVPRRSPRDIATDFRKYF